MRKLVTGAALLALGTTGCLAAGNYHSARPLGKGESAWGTTFSITTYEVEDEDTGEVDRVSIPNLMPEFSFHVGVTDDVQVGGRVMPGSLGLEADVLWRFFKSDKLHLAVAPSIGYQAFIVVVGTSTRLPGILTYDLSDNFSFNAALFVQATDYEFTDDDLSGDEDFLPFGGRLASTGLSIGFELRGETAVIRPALEFTQYVASLEDDSNFESFNTVNIMLHVAWIGGREKKQLNRIEQKIDNMNGPQPGYPPPQPYPQPQPQPYPPPQPAPSPY